MISRFFVLTIIAGWMAITPWITAGEAGRVGASGPSALTPLVVHPLDARDPLDVFEDWRRINRVSLPVPPSVLHAHALWEKTIGGGGHDARSSPRSTPDPKPGANTPLDGGVPHYQGESAVAVDPFNPSRLVAGANTYHQDPSPACQAPEGTTYGTMTLYGSHDGGRTWSSTCAPWPAEAVGSVGPEMFGSDPAVAWDSKGNAYAAYMLVSQTESDGKFSTAIVVARSSDAGTTWAPYGIIVNNLASSFRFDDKELMAIDATQGQPYSHPDRIYVIWDENNEERVAFSDDGASWTAVPLESNYGSIGGNLAVGPDGTVYAVWNRTGMGGGNGDKLMFSKSTDGGLTWSPAARIATHALSSFGAGNSPPAQDKRGVNAFASITANPCPTSPGYGALHVVFSDFPTSSTAGADLDVFLLTSTDGGRTWSDRRRLNDDPAGGTQFFPWIAADGRTGMVSAAWYDSREDADNHRTTIYMTTSADGGTIFSANVKVSRAAAGFANTDIDFSNENSTDNPGYNANQYGDYMQIAAGGGRVWPVWTDSRQCFPEFQDNTLREDLAAATVVLEEQHSRPVSPP